MPGPRCSSYDARQAPSPFLISQLRNVPQLRLRFPEEKWKLQSDKASESGRGKGWSSMPRANRSGSNGWGGHMAPIRNSGSPETVADMAAARPSFYVQQAGNPTPGAWSLTESASPEEAQQPKLLERN